MNGEGAQVAAEHKGGGLWVGMYRLDWKVDLQIVGGRAKPRFFDDPKDAKLAAWEERDARQRSIIRAQCDEVMKLRQQLDELFKEKVDGGDQGQGTAGKPHEDGAGRAHRGRASKRIVIDAKGLGRKRRKRA